jgi:tRNA G18 (ribose-2'-O)-methylase SpoU
MTSVRQRRNHAGIQAVVGAREQINQLHITRCRLSTSYSMLRVRKIQSFDLPELQPYRTMRRQEEQRKQGLFVAEGEKVVRRLLESDFRVVSALLPEKWLQELRPLLEKRHEKVEVFVAEKKLLETLTGFSMYQGLLAVGQVPPQPALKEVLSRSPRPRLLAAVDSLSSAENLGALVRNCTAFRVQALVVGETSSSPFLRRAVRSSMGTVFQLPIVEANSLVEALLEMRAAGIRCIAAHPHVKGRTLSQADFSQDFCLVFGSEGHGLSARILEACDEAVAIPMPPTVDSLNVGSAAAVFLYEANRQRGILKTAD